MKSISQVFTYIFTILLISFHSELHAQSNPGLQKVSPVLNEKIKSLRIPDSLDVILTVRNNRNDLFKLTNKNFEILYSNHLFIFLRLKASTDEIIHFSIIPEVVFIEDANRKARPEQQLSSLDLGTNGISYLHHRDSLIDGRGELVSLKEYLPDTNDIDIKGRYINSPVAATIVNSHATVMATLVCGAGNTWYTGRGAARGSKYTSSNYDILLPDPDQHYSDYGIKIQNHSYGVGIENYYGADAAAYDATSIVNPWLQHVFSSGNSGTSSSSTGRYAGIPGFANLTGSFKMAKNIITAGATDSFNIISGLSSKGPAYDGRIAPLLVAFGEDGSSGAAALVSGTGLILEQLYKSLTGSNLPNTLLRAALINGAIDKGNPGPDYTYGFGALNAINSFNTIRNGQYFLGTVAQGANTVFNLPVPVGISKLKLTLVWNDIPAAPNASKALINDLDLELKNIGTGEIWRPWILSSFPHADSLRKNATRGIDTLNNTEQVTLDLPAPGLYTITVKGTRVTSSTRDFHIAYQLDTAVIFTWTYPTSSDHIFPGENNIIRWQPHINGTGRIEYSTDNGLTWNLVQNNADLSLGYEKWLPPVLTTTALLKMTINGVSYVSEKFTISARTETRVSFNCPDSFGFAWTKLAPNLSYRVYELGDLYLEPVFETTDSFSVFNKAIYPSLYYAVAPLVDGIEGTRSYTFNYTQQGVGCYISTFISELQGSRAELDLTIGSTYQVTSVILEKWDGTNFVILREVLPGALSYHFTDDNLTQGANIYRARLVLSNGQSVLSQVETVYYFGTIDYLVFPNPVQQGQDISVGVKDVDYATARIYNSAGALIRSLTLDERINKISTAQLSKGMYIIKIISPAKAGYNSRFIVL